MRLPVSCATRARISPAALLVKVTARIASGSVPRSRRWAMRWTTTRVFPEPAPARTRRAPSVVVTARRCSGLRCDRSTMRARGRGMVRTAPGRRKAGPEPPGSAITHAPWPKPSTQPRPSPRPRPIAAPSSTPSSGCAATTPRPRRTAAPTSAPAATTAPPASSARTARPATAATTARAAPAPATATTARTAGRVTAAPTASTCEQCVGSAYLTLLPGVLGLQLLLRVRGAAEGGLPHPQRALRPLDVLRRGQEAQARARAQVGPGTGARSRGAAIGSTRRSPRAPLSPRRAGPG